MAWGDEWNLTKPEITNVSMHYDSHDSKTRTGYYDFTVCIKNIPSDWDYRNKIFKNMSKLNAEDIINIFKLRQIDLEEL